MLELNQLYNMDCMIGMSEFPDKYFDLAVVDPPYGINVGTTIGGAGGRSVQVGGGQLSSPKFTRGLTIRRPRIKVTLMNYLELVKIKSYSAVIISLNT